jgi:hypothetical protein
MKRAESLIKDLCTCMPAAVVCKLTLVDPQLGNGLCFVVPDLESKQAVLYLKKVALWCA